MFRQCLQLNGIVMGLGTYVTPLDLLTDRIQIMMLLNSCL